MQGEGQVAVWVNWRVKGGRNGERVRGRSRSRLPLLISFTWARERLHDLSLSFCSLSLTLSIIRSLAQNSLFLRHKHKTHRKRGGRRRRQQPHLQKFSASVSNFMLVFRRCRLQAAAGESCCLLWWFCWSSPCSIFASAAAATAKLERCGFFPETPSEKRNTNIKCRSLGRAMRICSASSSMEDLLVLTEQPVRDLRTAKEEYPVAQILFTTSRIISLKFLLSYCFSISAYIQNTRVFLIIFW